MKKDKRNILILIVLLIIIIIMSYFMFSLGITSKLRASIAKSSTELVDNSVDNYPVIDLVVNSSGEQYVNTDVAITVNASSSNDIAKLEYSFDLKKWSTVKENIGQKNISYKIVFNKTMNKKIYIRVENENGYKSYAYKTVVKIDKVNPVLEITNDNNVVIINAKDNVDLSSIQYSNDLMSWDEENISGNEIILRKENFNYNYIRVVDKVGNISKVKKIEI